MTTKTVVFLFLMFSLDLFRLSLDSLDGLHTFLCKFIWVIRNNKAQMYIILYMLSDNTDTDKQFP